MHILLTRPLDDSKELILKFTSMKHKVSHLPLLQIKKIETTSGMVGEELKLKSKGSYKN